MIGRLPATLRRPVATTDRKPAEATHCALAVSNTMTAAGMRRSPMGHNKMVQIAQAMALAEGFVLVEELPQVWRHGPVLHSLYLNLQHRRSDVVVEPVKAGPFGAPPMIGPDDARAMRVVRAAMERHQHDDDLRLSEIMHAPCSAWRETAAENGWQVPVGTVVPARRIAAYETALRRAA